jgi:hypothetical protein
MRSLSRQMLATSLLLNLTVIFLPGAALAVPMWSRRYGMECSTCHSFPSLQLTGTGLDFFRRGHRFESDSAGTAFPNFISAHGEWNWELQQHEPTAFPAPELHLHVGGAVSRLFSAYADANVNEDFEVLYLQLTKSFRDESYFTARQGKLTPRIIREYANGLMASASRPLIITDATLGENVFTPARDSFGADVAGRWKVFFAETGVLNGEEDPGQVLVGNHKDVYGTLELNAADDPSGVGLYYYQGGYDLADSVGDFRFDSYHRQGVFANLTRDQFRIAGAYLYGKDRFELLPDRKISGYYAQADGYPREWAVPFVRYDWVKTETEVGEETVRQATLGLGLRLFDTGRSGCRTVLEVARRKEGDTNITTGLVHILWAI